MPKYDLDKVKEKAAGQWASVLQRITGIDSVYLDGKHCPCPKCGGKDRFRVLNDFDQTGGTVCNQCRSNADGIATVEWYLGCSFLDALSKVAQCVGVDPETNKTDSKPKSNPAEKLQFKEMFPETIAKMWASKKKPIAATSLLLIAGCYATYRDRYPVFAFPAIGQTGQAVGWSIHHATGKELPIWTKGNKEPAEWKAYKTTSGSQAGWIGSPVTEATTIVWKVEGISDLLALLSLDLPANHSVCTNLFGCGEDPASNPWMLDRFTGKTVYVIHDCDKPGQSGATEVTNGTRSRPGWAPAIASTAKECRNVVLPYEIQETHGKDLRDWIAERLAEGLTKTEVIHRLIELAQRSNIVAGQAIKPKSAASVDPMDRFAIDDPHRLAQINLSSYRDNHGRALRYYKQTWYRYRDGQYSELSDDHFSSRLTQSISSEFERVYHAEFAQYQAWHESDKYDEANDKGPPKQRKTKVNLVRDVVNASKGLCILPASQRMHDWIHCEQSTDGICIAVANGILNVTKAIDESKTHAIEDVLLPHSTAWFSTTKLNFDFDPRAQCPNWIRFLHDVFNKDEQSIDLLQKWFGYLLTPDNSLQKILFVVGKKRSGKGTITQIMKLLFGESNIATPKLVHFARDFGLESLVDKSVGIITDARLPKKADDIAVMESLLSISGGDPQDVHRKYKKALSSFQLPIRFTVFSNEVPHLKDFSEAFVSRCMFLLMPNSYLGREDFGLLNRLNQELPGILNWAIIGRHMLNKEPRLIQPAKSAVLAQTLKSPVLRFCEERLEFANTEKIWIDTDDLFAAWTKWVTENQLDCLGTVQTFCRSLRAIEPTAESKQYRKRTGERSRRILGIRFSRRRINDVTR